MFTDTQVRDLKAPLDAAHVMTRQQAGMKLSYIEGWHAIREANRIFGFGNWDRKTELSKLCEPTELDGKFRVSFMAKVTITVRSETNGASVVRDGVGYGSGIAKSIGDALESAIKEAETDAMKRALMTFGNQFGLALYDKKQAEVTDTKSQARALYKEIESFIAQADDPLTLRTGMAENYGWLENEISIGSPIEVIHKTSAAGAKELLKKYSDKMKSMNQKESAA